MYLAVVLNISPTPSLQLIHRFCFVSKAVLHLTIRSHHRLLDPHTFSFCTDAACLKSTPSTGHSQLYSLCLHSRLASLLLTAGTPPSFCDVGIPLGGTFWNNVLHDTVSERFIFFFSFVYFSFLVCHEQFEKRCYAIYYTLLPIDPIAVGFLWTRFVGKRSIFALISIYIFVICFLPYTCYPRVAWWMSARWKVSRRHKIRAWVHRGACWVLCSSVPFAYAFICLCGG